MSTAVPPTDPPTSLDASRSPDRAVETLQRALAWARSEQARRASREVIADVAEGGWRVIRSIRMPTRQGVLDFFTHQVLVNGVGWLAGLATAHLVTHLFEVRGLRNLWGLAASGDRTLVSSEDHRLIMTITGFTVGLMMMLFVRHCLMRWISETRALRAERRGSARPEPGAPPHPAGLPTAHLDDLETEQDH